MMKTKRSQKIQKTKKRIPKSSQFGKDSSTASWTNSISEHFQNHLLQRLMVKKSNYPNSKEKEI
jgi:hypothetical protein